MHSTMTYAYNGIRTMATQFLLGLAVVLSIFKKGIDDKTLSVQGRMIG